MSDRFFETPILNSPYERPIQHWELDQDGQPTADTLNARRRSDLTTSVPKPKKTKKGEMLGSSEMWFDVGVGLSAFRQ